MAKERAKTPAPAHSESLLVGEAAGEMFGGSGRADAKATATATTAAVAPGKAYTVLARRYRSRDFGEVVGQEPIARTLQNAIEKGRTAHAYLFCGTRGVGKTSMARIFARALNRDSTLSQADAIGDAILRGEDLDVIEIDGASNRGIDDARDLIAGASLAPTRGRYRIYIIDEVHMLTTPAFNALLKTMEEPASHVKFILCTTEPHKVPQTIQSRCQRFDFRNIPTKQIAAHLGAFASGEGIEVTEEVLLAVARLANGSMRDGLSLLDRLLASASGRIDGAVLEQVFGLPDDEILLDIVDACVSERIADALPHGARLLERGSGVEQALELLAERLRWVLVASAVGSESELLEVAASMRARVSGLAAQTDAAFCAHAIALCDATARNARGSSAPRALYDACLARLALSTRFSSGASLLAGGGGADSKKAGNPAARVATGPQREANGGGAPAVQTTVSAVHATLEPKVSVPVAVASPPRVVTLEELRARLEEVAERSPRDRAMTDLFEVTAWADGSATVALLDPHSGSFLASNSEPIAALLSRVAGRPVRIKLDLSALEKAVEAPRAMAVDDPSVRQDPLVRRAAELLDATVVSVTPRFSQELKPSNAPSAPEAAEGDTVGRDERSSVDTMEFDQPE